MKLNHIRLLLILPGFFLASCIGTKVALHTTSSNFGVDIDSLPPTTDISLGRSELAIQPAFADGQTPSSIMGFSAGAGQGGFLKRFFFGTSSIFTTGQAAANLAGAEGDTNTDNDRISVPLESSEAVEPTRPSAWEVIFGKRRRKPFNEDEMFPLVTGTHTNYGLHVQWDAATQTPQAIKAGFNRKEVSFAPVIGSPKVKGGAVDEAGNPVDKPFTVKLPSVLAAHQQDTQVGTLEGTEAGSVKFDYVQYLATGKAAELLGKDAKVRAVLRKQLTESEGDPKKTAEGANVPPVTPAQVKMDD